MSIDLEAILTKTIQESKALAGMLLKEGQLITSTQPGLAFEPTELLPVVQAGTDGQLSIPEFHLLPLDEKGQEPVLVLAQAMDSESFCLLVFPLETSLSTAEQASRQLLQQLDAAERPQPSMPDLTGLRLRSGDSMGSGSWQDELFQPEAGSNTMKHPHADPAADSPNKVFWYQVF
ncbi:MAG TPA: hypothetical protein DCG78_01580 [Anaerolineaceae bacterium]|nr:hypothetical protein [Anaerolineaceae bacterium]